MTDAQNTQIAMEQWADGVPVAQVTQIVVEHWAPGLPVLQVTQIAVEHWASLKGTETFSASFV
jgi:hypothetical protein